MLFLLSNWKIWIWDSKSVLVRCGAIQPIRPWEMFSPDRWCWIIALPAPLMMCVSTLPIVRRILLVSLRPFHLLGGRWRRLEEIPGECVGLSKERSDLEGFIRCLWWVLGNVDLERIVGFGEGKSNQISNSFYMDSLQCSIQTHAFISMTVYRRQTNVKSTEGRLISLDWISQPLKSSMSIFVISKSSKTVFAITEISWI